MLLVVLLGLSGVLLREVVVADWRCLGYLLSCSYSCYDTSVSRD